MFCFCYIFVMLISCILPKQGKSYFIDGKNNCMM